MEQMTILQDSVLMLLFKELIDSSLFKKRKNRLFVLAFNNATENVANNPISNTANRVEINSHRKYFLPRVDITKYNVLIDGRNVYDQRISDQIRKSDEIRKVEIGQRDDYTAVCLVDYEYFKDHYQLIAGDLSKQKN